MQNLQRWRREAIDHFTLDLRDRGIDLDNSDVPPPRPSIIIKSVREMPYEVVLTKEEMRKLDSNRADARIPTGLTPYWVARPVNVTIEVRIHFEQHVENCLNLVKEAVGEEAVAAALAAAAGREYSQYQSPPHPGPASLKPSQGKAGKKSKKKKKGKVGGAAGAVSGAATVLSPPPAAAAAAGGMPAKTSAGPLADGTAGSEGGGSRQPYQFHRRDHVTTFPLKLWFARGPLPRQQVKDLQGSCGPWFLLQINSFGRSSDHAVV